MSRIAALVCLLLALALPALAQEPDETDGLRERLTEREDKRRPPEPFQLDVRGRPLVLGGEYEGAIAGIRRYALGRSARQRNRVLLEQQLELEAFYSFGQPLSLFAQVDLVMEEDLLAHTLNEVSDQYVEFGEIWLASEHLFGSNLSVDAGRLHFEDDRRWWWDDELDAVRLTYEKETFELAFAVGRAVVPRRSDQSYVEPENDRVLRWIGEATWDWSPNHAFDFFFLASDDHSPTPTPGDVVAGEREDDSDARQTWVGARALGAFELGAGHFLGYWLEAASVRGRERVIDYEDVSSTQSQVTGIAKRNVGGWGIDTGLNWMLPGALEPRIFGGFATTSKDRTPESGSDRTFRQTELHTNEAGFGGVEHYPNYGILLRPELSNLRVWTLGAGIALFRSSSLDLVYHYDRLIWPAEQLRDSLLDVELDGRNRDLGQEIDLVLDLEEWTRLELHFAVSGFRAGRAFGADSGNWAYGGGLRVNYAF